MRLCCLTAGQRPSSPLSNFPDIFSIGANPLRYLMYTIENISYSCEQI